MSIDELTRPSGNAERVARYRPHTDKYAQRHLDKIMTFHHEVAKIINNENLPFFQRLSLAQREVERYADSHHSMRFAQQRAFTRTGRDK